MIVHEVFDPHLQRDLLGEKGGENDEEVPYLFCYSALPDSDHGLRDGEYLLSGRGDPTGCRGDR